MQSVLWNGCVDVECVKMRNMLWTMSWIGKIHFIQISIIFLLVTKYKEFR